MKKRSCGSCTACCVTHGISELKKPDFTPCPKLAACGGCSIYPTKPRECTLYHCSWLTGVIGSEDQRPDIVGLVPDIVPLGRHARLFPSEVVLGELRPGAQHEMAGRIFIADLVHAGYAVRVFSPEANGSYSVQYYATTALLAEHPAVKETATQYGISIILINDQRQVA